MIVKWKQVCWGKKHKTKQPLQNKTGSEAGETGAQPKTKLKSNILKNKTHQVVTVATVFLTLNWLFIDNSDCYSLLAIICPFGQDQKERVPNLKHAQFIGLCQH